MCGVFCIASDKNVKAKILDGLSFLEYRGYDSAGISFIDDAGKLTTVKALGNVSRLIEASKTKVDGNVGVGHTRWATHGAATLQNTHPMANKEIAVVHNGIIENYKQIKNRLIKQDYKFNSETDTEVVLNLLQYYIDQGNNELDAIKYTLKEIKGTYALAVLFVQNNHTIYCAKNSSPLIIGVGEQENYIASDINALALFVDKVISLEDGDIALISQDRHEIFDAAGKATHRDIQKVVKKELANNLKGYPCYLLKEINEQPRVIKNIIYDAILGKKSDFLNDFDWSDVSKVSIIACGSSYNAGLVAKYWFESYARITAEVEFASEFRARDIVYDRKAAYIFISQSGETLDTLMALKEAKKENVKTIALVNTLGSSIANLSDYSVPLQAGIEVSVAATKSFAAQLMHLANFVLLAAVNKGMQSEEDYVRTLKKLEAEVGKLINSLPIDDGIKTISDAIVASKNTIFLGRQYMYPIALEGALKLKELSYLSVFSNSAGELKHGTIAIIDTESLVIALAPKNSMYHKIMSNVEEVMARGAKVVLITDAEKGDIEGVNVDHIYKIQKVSEILMPLFFTIPLQLISYQVAYNLGNDVDKPRNLAKSVTVE
jgi:glucosamine--fructose-6-phosphate aminotransferase (isomerizing)